VRRETVPESAKEAEPVAAASQASAVA
jgi:hypothetical protein